MRGWYLLYYPFEGLGRLLRMLSLHSAQGNVLAFCLYVLFALLPLGAGLFWLRRTKRAWRSVDCLLLVLCAYSFYLLYQFINPFLLLQGMPGAMGAGEELLPVLKCLCAGLWYVILISYLVLRLTRELTEASILDRKEFLYQGLSRLLLGSMIFFGVTAFWGAGVRLMETFAALEKNAAASDLDRLFAVLRFLFTLAPQAAFLHTLWTGRKLLQALDKDPYAKETVHTACCLSEASVRLIRTAVGAELLWNAGMFCFRGMLTSTDYTLELPLFPLIAAFGALILARYFREAGELYRENEMII